MGGETRERPVCPQVSLALGAAKIAVGLAGTEATGGLAVGLGYYTAYSGLGNIAGGFSQLYGGLSGNVAAGKTGSDYATSISSVSGIGTLIATRGNAEAGAMASALEGIALAGANVPLAEGGSIPTPTGQENAVSAVDNASALYPLIAGDQNNGCH